MRRRSFLKAGLILGLSTNRLQAAGLAKDQAPPRVVVLHGIDSATDLLGLRFVMDGLVAQQIPFGCVINPSAEGATALMPNDPMAQLLRDYYVSYPGLMEVIPLVPDIELRRPYFQARLASLAVSQLSETLGLAELHNRRQSISTLACWATPDPRVITAVRAAGIRTVLSLPQAPSQALSNRQSENGVLHMIGGQNLDLATASPADFERAIAHHPGIVALSAQSFQGFDVAARAGSFLTKAKLLRRSYLTGDGGPMLPRDILIRDGTSFARTIALHILDAPASDPVAQQAVTTMHGLLAQHDIGFSTSPAPVTPRASLEGLAFWLPMPQSMGPGLRNNSLEQPVWASFSTALETPFPAGLRGTIGQEVILRIGHMDWRGMDAKGRYHQFLSLEVKDGSDIERMLASMSILSDGLIVLRPQILAKPAQRDAILRALNALQGDAVTRIVGLPTLMGQVLPRDDILPLYRRTEAVSPTFTRRTAAPAVNMTDAQHAALIEDAKTAWRYFEKMTSPRTGLCVAANNFASNSRDRYNRVTMWDVGSHINALMAAVDLQFIDKANFRKQTARILARIVGRQIKGLQLPPEEIDVISGRSTRRFNASDTCRLLAALANLAKHPMADAALVDKTVKGWDLEKVVLDGRLHAIFGGAFVPADSSQYAHYSAMGLERWGIKAVSPFSKFHDSSLTDQKFLFLERVQALGPVGTEPLLLEAIEHGASVSADYLMDVLFAALVSEYRKTGRILCPSETPLNRSPWFVYQGLQIGDAVQPWQVNVEEEGLSQAKTLSDSFAAISCKSAYLWAAVIDHPFALTLLETVRSKARDDVGFASCIYVETGEASTNYTDINTNGIILQSIAHWLQKR